uniref:Non-specific serine/threonine protein kinase n=1 Tax=Heterorhabditis bacteriophora TaxID=37862 RepID=A0A1I7XE26_HETBA
METELTMQKGIIDLSSQMHSKVRRNAHQYTDNCDISRINIPMNICRMNNEWNEMFGSEANHTAKWTEEKSTSAAQMRSMRSSVCGAQLAELLQHKNELYIKKVYRGRQRRDESRSQSTAKVIGTLITHLHEHTDKITQMSLIHDRSLFASASLDGYVKLWSTRAVTGECYGAVRSEASFCYNKNFPITSLGWAGNDVLAMSAGDGHIVWANVSSTNPQIITKVYTLYL